MLLSTRVQNFCSRQPVWVTMGISGGTLLWLGSAWGARWIAENVLFGWQIAELYAMRGKWMVFAGCAFGLLGVVAKRPPLTKTRTVSLVFAEIVLMAVLTWRTMPIYPWLPRTLERDEQGHIRQSIEFTCGPVALGNLLEQWGQPSPHERDLARLSGTTYEGTTMGGLIRAAEANGFAVLHCAPMRVEELKQQEHPVIIQISTLPGLLHATVLTHFSEDGAHAIDPAYGQRTIRLSRLERILTGTALVLQPVNPNSMGE